ncbi:MAG: porin family protein, partial [Beijerinckiaceae bacterium]
MGLLKTFALTGGVVLTTAFGALAADLAPPPPPMPAAPVPLRGSIDQSGVYLRGDVGMGMMGSTNVRYMDPNGVLGASTITMRQGELGNVGFAGIGVGYQFNNWFRFDVTGELRGTAKGNFGDSYTNAVNTGTNALFGSISSSVFLANA